MTRMLNDPWSLDQIRDYWTRQAAVHGCSSDASWSDISVIEMELREIAKRLRDGDRVLDAGCANGYSTMQLATRRNIEIRGIDFIPEMINHARERAAEISTKISERMDFRVGDIMSLDEPDNHYDVVVVIRVVINLRDWQRQLAAVSECVRVLKPGGRLLLSEATVQGWRKLNQFRKEWGLESIPMPDFNCYIDHDQLVDAVRDELELVDIVNFASTYYVATRILKPLLAAAGDGRVDATQPDMEWNRFWCQAPAWGDYGTQKLLVFQKPLR